MSNLTSVLCQPDYQFLVRFWHWCQGFARFLRFRGPCCRLRKLDHVIHQSILEQSRAGDTVWLLLYKSVTFVCSVHSVHHVACNIVSLLRVLSMYVMHVTAVFSKFMHMIQDWRPECRNALVSAAATLLWVICEMLFLVVLTLCCEGFYDQKQRNKQAFLPK